MATTRSNIRSWLKRAKETGATHMLVVCDTFDYDDYPVYVMPGENLQAVTAAYDGKNMQKIMECYSLSLDIEEQLKEVRAFHE